MANYDTVLYDVDGSLATVTMNRPDSRNGINNTLMRELYECLSEIAYDPQIRAVLFTGAGHSFCPGADLKLSESDVQEPMRREYFHITTLLHEMPKVTIAGINGACAGAGFGWACACDIRYATERATFNSAFLGVAISGDMGGPWLLPRILGSQKARELYFLPDKFKAPEAAQIGLIARALPDNTFRDDVRGIAERISKSAPLAIGEMKKNFVNAENMTLRDYIELETERHTRVGSSEDTSEAFKAFVEKREPTFKGR